MPSAPFPVIERAYESIFGDTTISEEILPLEEVSNEIERRRYTIGVDELANVMLRRAHVNWLGAIRGISSAEPPPEIVHFIQGHLRKRVIFHFSGHGHAPQPVTTTNDDLHIRFSRLAHHWRAETAFLSSPSDIVLNLNYQQIIGMGPAVVPLIMEELEQNGGYWYWALRAITGADPVPPDERGDARKMKEAWLNWYRQSK